MTFCFRRDLFTTVLVLQTSFLFFNPSVLSAGELVSVFPTGSVKQVQQITARFSTDMVAMGDPRSKADPLKLVCNQATGKNEVDGSGGEEESQGSETKSKKATKLPKYTTRWADTKTWSLDFDKPLSAGVQCTLKLNSAAAKDLGGKIVTAADSYTFSTSGPALLGVAPRYGDIEPEQYFVLQLDGEVQKKSVESIAYFEAEGVPDKISARVVIGKDRDTVIRAAVNDNWNWNSFRKYTELKKPVDSIPELKGFLVLAGGRRFPEGRQLTLHWPKGILSASGLPVEEPQDFEFKVIPPFEAKLNCSRENPDRPCNPILDLFLNFTNRVKLESLKGAKLVGPKGQTWLPIELKEGDQNKNVHGSHSTGAKSSVGVAVISNFADKQVDVLTFKGPFPEKLALQLVLPKGIRDELGRALINEDKFPLATGTDEYSPLVKFAAPFGILELNAEPALPVSLRNVEAQLKGQSFDIDGKSFVFGSTTPAREIISMFNQLGEKEFAFDGRTNSLLSKQPKAKPFTLPKPSGEREFELVGIPMKEPGLHVVEIGSPRLGASLIAPGATMYVASGALVTNLSVHFKKGRESSLVWVTQLDSGRAVPSAQVALYDNTGKELAKATSDASGLARFGRVKYPCARSSTEEDEGGESGGGYGHDCAVFAFAKLANDFSFVSSEWSKGIEDYRFNLSREYLAPQWGPIVAHTILDRAVLQAGETLNMKHLVREHTMLGFRALSAKAMPKRVLIVHQGSRKTYTVPFDYDKATGAALTTFKLPKEASLGLYEIYLSNKATLPSKESDDNDTFDWSAHSTGNFMVAEYRLPLMQSNVKILGAPLVQPKDVKVDLSASYLSGGPAKGLKVRVRSTVSMGSFKPDVPGADEYSFFAKPLKSEIEKEEKPHEFGLLSTVDVALGENGGSVATVKDIPPVTSMQSLTVEMEYRDPNGEIKTASASQALFPGQAIVGLKSETWMATAGKVSVNGIITNELGKPLANTAFVVDGFRRDEITHRKRLVGGFYAYDSKTKVTGIGQLCTGKSDRDGRFICNAKGLAPGSLVLQAKVSDSKNRATYASAQVSVYGEDQNMWWTPGDSDRIDLIPERTRYEPGDKATVAVRSPFPKSTVLVTIEREGVIDSFVKEITRDQSTVEIPIKPNYAPNVFISVTAIRGRVGEPAATALIDMAKPSLKLGMSEIKVGWKAHELKVSVTTEKKRYHVRDQVAVSIKVTRADGKPLLQGSEVALIAVDESLSLLRRNYSTDVLEAMMGQRALAVNTSTSQNQIIGRRHFGAKAKPPGGGGGRASASDSREFFDPLLLWNGRLKLDGNGEAKATIPLNDSLTNFRFVAVATSGFDQFGDGSTQIESTKDVIIYSGFAPLVRDGDQIANRFTIRNTTAQAMKLNVAVQSSQIKNLPSVPPFELKAGDATTLEIPVTVPAGLKEIEFVITAKDTISGAADSMKAKVKVAESVPDRVLMATLFQLDKSQTVPVQQPKDAIPGRGGLNIEAKDTLVRGLGSVKSYMEDYPYTCLEQKVSKGIVAESKADVTTAINEMPTYFDSAGLLKFFPSSLCGDVQLTRYVLGILHENAYPLPELTLERATGGLRQWLNNGPSCSSWWSSVVRDNYRDQERVAVMETLSRYKKFEVGDLQTIKQTPNLWTTEAVTAWYRLLQREATIPRRDELLKQADNILHARVNYQGSLMNLQGTLDWEARWMLFTSADQEALGVFGVSIDAASWQGDTGKMARGVVARLKRGVWDSTLANAWAVTNLRKFSAKFEKTIVTGSTDVVTPDQKYSFNWSKSPTGGETRLEWPKASVAAPSSIEFKQSGTGKPWMLLQTRSAIPLKAPWDLGYKIARRLIPVTQKTAGKWSDGDVVNVELTVTSKYDQPWVVVRDPIPGGASHLGTGLSGSSALLDRAPKQKANVNDPESWPMEFEEKSNASFTSYAAYLPKGTYRLNYRIRLNSSGTFRLPQTRVEAMYSPETFGESPNGPWVIQK